MAREAGWIIPALVVVMLVSGSINTLSKSAQNQVVVCSDCLSNNKCADKNSYPCMNDEGKFSHVWSQTLVMMCGEALCFIAFLIQRKRETGAIFHTSRWLEENPNTPQGLLNDGEFDPATAPPIWKPLFQPILLIPTCCDLIGTTVAAVGLLFVSGSVWQMLRGSILIWTALLSVVFLKRKLFAHHYAGLFITLCGLACVGSSSFLDEDGGSGSGSNSPGDNDDKGVSSGETLIGIISIFVGQLLSASQMVIEEKFMKGRNLHPLQIVGTEGCFGAIIMAGIVLPILGNAVPGPDTEDGKGQFVKLFHDNLHEAAVQMSSDGLLGAMTILYWCSIAAYNFAGLAVTKRLSAIVRTLVDALRTIVVWVVGIIIYYGISTKYGEKWSVPGSLLELGGFVLLLIGTPLYKGILHEMCGYKVPEATAQCDQGGDNQSKTTARSEVESVVSDVQQGR